MTVEPTVVPSRRDRLRAATIAEIRQEARALLVTGGETAVSLREVARRMGLTPAALYRYVDSHEQLVELVGVDIHEDLIASMEGARDADPRAGAVPRLLAVSREFRRWALAHPREFRMVFANPMQSPGDPCDGPLEEAGERMGAVFGELFAELLRTGEMRVPSPDEVDPGLLAVVARSQKPGEALPPTALVVFTQCWAKLYGCVVLEVSGHLTWALEETSPMFELVLREGLGLMGMPEAYTPPPG